MLRFLYGLQKYKSQSISVNGAKYSALVADTGIKRAIGLMFRTSLKKGQCMLFVFSGPGYHAIWMRNMRFSIDAIWLDKKGKVVDIKEGLVPCMARFALSCPQFAPREKASYLVELGAGETKRKKIRRGAMARL